MNSEPVGVEANREEGTLRIDWQDGHSSVYSTELLRWACPCAVCQGEWGRPGLLSTTHALAPEEVRLTDLLPVGTYALTPVWESGHASGIYSYEYLRGLCPCGECSSSREAEQSE
jgi:DUF971 family protein